MASAYDYHNSNGSNAQLQPPSTSPYGSGDPYYNESSGYIASGPAKKGTSKWIKFGIPLALVVIAGAVVGGIFGSRSSKDGSSSSTTGGSSSPSAVVSAKNAVGRFATATDTDYFMPVYPSTVSAFKSSFVCSL